MSRVGFPVFPHIPRSKRGFIHPLRFLIKLMPCRLDLKLPSETIRLSGSFWGLRGKQLAMFVWHDKILSTLNVLLCSNCNRPSGELIYKLVNPVIARSIQLVNRTIPNNASIMQHCYPIRNTLHSFNIA